MNRRWCGAPAGVLFSIAFLAIVVAILLGSCGYPAPPASTDPTTPDTVAVAAPPVPTTALIVAPALSHLAAVRVDPPEPTAPPDPCGPEAHAYVDTLPYEWGNKAATTEAYRVVATCAGWSQATQDVYRHGIIDDIFVGESAQCPYHRGRQTVGEHCAPITPNGVTPGEDSGLFMVTAAGWGPAGIACTFGGYCSPQSIIGTAWDSMMAGLVLIMHQPKRPGFPWTWDKGEPGGWSCGYHPVVCHMWPSRFVNLP